MGLAPNPNGANQFQVDPRQKLFWEHYVNPKSDTFGNITQSALKVGYTEGYADEIGTMDWFRALLWRLNATLTGEKKMKELLELDMRNGGENIDVGIARIQADLAKFLAETQGKNEGYSKQSSVDLTSGGEPFKVDVVSFKPEE